MEIGVTGIPGDLMHLLFTANCKRGRHCPVENDHFVADVAEFWELQKYFISGPRAVGCSLLYGP